MTPSVSRRLRRRAGLAGFTLIELLTVIAIIGILAAILIPTVAKVRESARWTQGSSNIRQCTMAMLSYANDNRGRLMAGHEEVNGGVKRYWGSVVTQYLAKRDLAQYPAITHDITRDPVALADSRWSDPATHAKQFAPMPYTRASDEAAPPQLLRFRKLDAHVQPHQQIYLADAGLTADGDSHGDSYMADGSVWGWSAVWGGTPAAGEATLPITPGDSSPGNIRWTNGKAKFAFLDGHVEALPQARVLKRMMNPLYQ